MAKIGVGSKSKDWFFFSILRKLFLITYLDVKIVYWNFLSVTKLVFRLANSLATRTRIRGIDFISVFYANLHTMTVVYLYLSPPP